MEKGTGIHAVGLVDPHRARRTDAMAVQEHHDLANDLLLGPGVGDSLGAHSADTGHLAQPFRLGLDDIEYFLAERPDHLPSIDRPDAVDHAGAKVFLDAVLCQNSAVYHFDFPQPGTKPDAML